MFGNDKKKDTTIVVTRIQDVTFAGTFFHEDETTEFGVRKSFINGHKVTFHRKQEGGRNQAAHAAVVDCSCCAGFTTFKQYR
jgi:hypothetical protein